MASSLCAIFAFTGDGSDFPQFAGEKHKLRDKPIAKSCEKSNSVCVFGATIRRSGAPIGALLLLFFYFETGGDKFMDLIFQKEMTFAELSINFVAWIGVPDEAYDLHKQFTIFSELGVTCLQERERSVAQTRFLRGEHPIDLSP
jgi:hypothetical protein